MALDKLTTIQTSGIVATGIVTSNSFAGDGSGLTGVVGSGSGVVVQDDTSVVGTAGTIDFGTALDVSAISSGIVTVTASGGSGSIAGIDTTATSIFSTLDIGADIDVDGHTELDNINIAGVTTFAGNIDANADIDIDGHTNLDNVSIAGVTTFSEDVKFTGATAGRDITFDRSSNRLNFADSADATFGNSNDLLLYHSGSHSFVQHTGTGNLQILSNNIFFATGSGSEQHIAAYNNNRVDLYFNNSVKITTTNTGAVVTGILTATSFVGDGSGLTGISAGGGVTVQDEGSALSTTGTTLNFVGSGVVASGTGATKTITIAGGGSGVTVQDEGSSLSTSGTTLNFVGSGVVASGTGATKTITIAGGGAGTGEVFVNLRNDSNPPALSDTGRNIIVGYNAGHKFQNGSATGGNENIFFGYNAGFQQTAGDGNVLIGAGANAGGSHTSSSNVYIGKESGRFATGGNNVCLGTYAGNVGGFSGSNNIVIGYNADPSSASTSNEITLGDANITKLRVPGIGVTFKDNGGTPTQGHVLTVDANGEASFAAASGGGIAGISTTGTSNFANIQLIGITTGLNVSGVLTAAQFSGDGANLTSLPAAQLSGTAAAINGSNITNLSAGNLSGTLPALDGSALTGIAVTEAPITNFTVTANGSSAYRFAGGGVDTSTNNPDLYLERGQKYRFNNTTGSSHPFRFRVSSGGSTYSSGVSGSENGVQFFTVPYDAPPSIVYQCTIHGGMVGTIYIGGGQYQTRSNNLCLQYTSSSANYTSGTIIYGTEVFDVGDSNAYNTSNGEFTAPVTGVYRIQYEYFASGAGRATAGIEKYNGSSWSTVKNGMRVYSVSGGSNWASVPTIFYLQLNATEKFRIIWQEGTVHLNTPWNHLTVQLVQ